MALPKKKTRRISVAGVEYRWGAFPAKPAPEIRVELLDEPASQLLAKLSADSVDNMPTVGPGLVAELIQLATEQGWDPYSKTPRHFVLDDISEVVQRNDLNARKEVLCIVITPFDAGAARVRDTISRAARELGIQVRDTTDAPKLGIITDWISEAHLIIADITRQNPNVFYELGFAHAQGKTTVLLVDGTTETRVPSSLAGQLFLTYDPEELANLTASLQKTLLRFIRLETAK